MTSSFLRSMNDKNGTTTGSSSNSLNSLSPPSRLHRNDSNTMPVADLFGGMIRNDDTMEQQYDDEVPNLRTIRRGNPWMSSFYSTTSNNSDPQQIGLAYDNDDDDEDTDTVVMQSSQEDDDDIDNGNISAGNNLMNKKRPTDNYPAGKEETSPIKFDFNQWRSTSSITKNSNNLETIPSFDSNDDNHSPPPPTPTYLTNNGTSKSKWNHSSSYDHDDFCTGSKVRKLHIHDHTNNNLDRTTTSTTTSTAINKRLDFGLDPKNHLSVEFMSPKREIIKHKSPTDIFGFPSSSSSYSKQTPGTPTRDCSNMTTRQPPLSPTRTTNNKNAFPPETPMIHRHAKSSPRTPHTNPVLTTTTNNNNVVSRNVFTFPSHTPNDNPSPERKSRFATDFEIISRIGDGSFGTVYKCRSKLDGCKYAIKETKRAARGPTDRDRMLKEVYALAAICDQADTATFHIVRYHQAWMDDDQKLYIQTELCTSTLSHEIMQNKLINLDRRFKLLREILLALEFIHRNKMVHLDIKPDNIFIKDGKFKLGDFGLASKHQTKNTRGNDHTNYYYGEIEEGDSRYMSMDLLREDHHDLTKSDVFSLGATMYEICINRSLPSDGQEWQDIRKGRLAPMNNTPMELQSIIVSMMHPHIDERPSASELLTKKQLLSEEQKLLQLERTKVLEAKVALAAQQAKLKKLSPPKKALIRANTWNGL